MLLKTYSREPPITATRPCCPVVLLDILVYKIPSGLCFQLTLVESLQQWWHDPACLIEEGFRGCRHVGWIHGELLLLLKSSQSQKIL